MLDCLFSIVNYFKNIMDVTNQDNLVNVTK